MIGGGQGISYISIHALLAESDHGGCGDYFEVEISIHALLAESDRRPGRNLDGTVAFLSTLSLRRATSPVANLKSRRRNFYPRSPCGERPGNAGRCLGGHHFYPRSPCGERPQPRRFFFSRHTISIHALLAESDKTNMPAGAPRPNFYPRSPCGERRWRSSMPRGRSQFLSTLSLRRATTLTRWLPAGNLYFYPRSPCGERRGSAAASSEPASISIHALLAESDAPSKQQQTTGAEFLSTLSLRRATP